MNEWIVRPRISAERWEEFATMFKDAKDFPRTWDAWVTYCMMQDAAIAAAGNHTREVLVEASGFAAWLKQRGEKPSYYWLVIYANVIDGAPSAPTA